MADQIDQVDGFIGNVASQYIEVVAVEQKVAVHWRKSSARRDTSGRHDG